MNENDINILLDQFVDGLEASESASVIQKINSRPAWSDTYQKISRVFGSLSTVREQDNQQPAPAGLASKTFQKILELENSKKTSSSYFAQKENASATESVSVRSRNANNRLTPSFLMLCTCAGFLLVITPALLFFMGNSSVSGHATPGVSASVAQVDLVQPSVSSSKYADYGIEFAVTGASKHADSPHFCNSKFDSQSAMITNCSDTTQFKVNTSDKLVCLNSSAEVQAPHYQPVGSKIACPDGCAVFVSQTEGQPVIIVSSSSINSDLLKEQKILQNSGDSHNNISVPVFYQQ